MPVLVTFESPRRRKKIRNIQFNNQLSSLALSWDAAAKKIHKLQPRSSSSSSGTAGAVSERQTGMDFQSAMETFAEAWVAATAGAQVHASHKIFI